MTDHPARRAEDTDPFIRIGGVLHVLDNTTGALPAETVQVLRQEIRSARDQLMHPLLDPLEAEREWAQLTIVLSTKPVAHTSADGVVHEWYEVTDRAKLDVGIVGLHKYYDARLQRERARKDSIRESKAAHA